MGRWLGIDYGERRIGVALSDPGHIIASPLHMIENNGGQAVRDVVQDCEDHDVERIVVGLPYNMDGSKGASAEYAEAFAEKLREAAKRPVVMWDERLSTMTAEKALIEGGTRREKRKNLVDKIAAQVILQHYIDAQAPTEFDVMDDGFFDG